MRIINQRSEDDGFLRLLESADDALTAFLAWEDLLNTTHSCRAAVASRLRWKWLRNTQLRMPPDAAACAVFLESADAHYSAIRCLSVAHTNCIDSPAARATPWLAAVEKLTVEPARYQLPYNWTAKSINLDTIATACPALQDLSLAMLSDVVDLAALVKLTVLRRLDLSSTAVHDLAPLAKLHQLEHINLSRTCVQSFKPLFALANLESLVIDGDTRWSLAALSNLPALTDLSVRDLRLSDDVEEELDAVVPQLVRFTCLGPPFFRLVRGNRPRSWSRWWKLMPVLEELDVQKTVLFDRLDTATSLRNLRILRLSTLRESDLSPLAELLQLEEVSLTAEQCVDLSPLAALPRLRSLYCHGGDPDSMELDIGHHQYGRAIELRLVQILDVSNHYLRFLTRLDALRELVVYVWSGDSLMLAKGEAADLRSLSISGSVDLHELHSRFPRLCSVELRQCACFNADELKLFAGLQSLSVMDAATPDVIPKQRMLRLVKLQLRGSIASSLHRIVNMPFLHELNLEKTDVEDISSLTVLHELRVLNLKETRVCDATPLLAIKALEKITLPKRALCGPLVAAFHDQSNVVCNLRELLHPTKNCLWGAHRRGQPSRPRK